MTGTVEEIDASVLTKQFTDFFNTYSAAVLDEFSAYKQNMEKYLTSITHILWRRCWRAATGAVGRVAALVPCIAAVTRGMSMRTLALVGRVTLCRRRAKAQPDKRG